MSEERLKKIKEEMPKMPLYLDSLVYERIYRFKEPIKKTSLHIHVWKLISLGVLFACIVPFLFMDTDHSLHHNETILKSDLSGNIVYQITTFKKEYAINEEVEIIVYFGYNSNSDAYDSLEIKVIADMNVLGKNVMYIDDFSSNKYIYHATENTSLATEDLILTESVRFTLIPGEETSGNLFVSLLAYSTSGDYAEVEDDRVGNFLNVMFSYTKIGNKIRVQPKDK